MKSNTPCLNQTSESDKVSELKRLKGPAGFGLMVEVSEMTKAVLPGGRERKERRHLAPTNSSIKY